MLCVYANTPPYNNGINYTVAYLDFEFLFLGYFCEIDSRGIYSSFGPEKKTNLNVALINARDIDSKISGLFDIVNDCES